MIEFETVLFLMTVGSVSLIITLVLCLTGKKIDSKKKNEEQIFEINIFNFQLKLVPFLYLIIVLILFLLGIFSDFLINSIFGLIIALIPFVAYWILNYKKDGLVKK
jgi:uncharacterized membrane protein